MGRSLDCDRPLLPGTPSPTAFNGLVDAVWEADVSTSCPEAFEAQGIGPGPFGTVDREQSPCPGETATCKFSPLSTNHADRLDRALRRPTMATRRRGSNSLLLLRMQERMPTRPRVSRKLPE